MSDPSTQTHTNDNRPVRNDRDREIAELREYKRRYDNDHDARSLVAEYEGDVIPTLRERAEKAEAALDDIVTAYDLPGEHCELEDAITAARKLLPEEKR